MNLNSPNIIFNAQGLQSEKICPICKAKPHYLYKQHIDTAHKSTRETEKTLKLLNLKTLTCQIAVCPKCYHAHKYPLYDERMIFSAPHFEVVAAETSARYPEDVAERKNISLSQVFKSGAHAFYYFHHILKNLYHIPNKQVSGYKILDWGGGDGYLAASIATVLNKRFYNIMHDKVQAYIYDIFHHYKELEADETYVHYIGQETIQNHGPYDLIIFSHVFEHVANPNLHIKNMLQHLSEDGIIQIIVPYEQSAILRSVNARIQSHQHLFSPASLYKLLENEGLQNIQVNLNRQLSNKDWLFASAIKSKSESATKSKLACYKRQSLWYLMRHVLRRMGALFKL